MSHPEGERRKWSFDPDDFTIQYDGFSVGSMRDQWDTEDSDSAAGDAWDGDMRELGEMIVATLNAAKLRWRKYDESEAVSDGRS